MASFLSALNPTPTFPAYTGPFQVGSVDYEVPISELTPEEKRPEAEISTVQFRVFYPCEKVSSKPKPVRWIPEPQRGYLDGYAKFGGAGKFISSILSSAPSIFNYITIPVHRDAPLHKPNSNTGKWPVLVFSHGLGGTRHMYSHLLGSLASHGMVCIAPEHRDGSAPVSFIESNISSGKATKETTRVDYIRVSHTASPEVEDTRNNQLRIRLWELAQIHDAIHKLDRGMLDQYAKGSSSAKSPPARSSIFQNSLEIHKPGSIVWGGHSFGAATTVQFIKSVFYNSTAEDSFLKSGLYITPQSSPLKEQITPKTPVILLDLWCLPVEAMSTQSLFQKPMPTYAPSGPQGSNLLSVCSEQFFKWNANFKMTLRIISSNPADEKPKSLASGPHLFYAATSAHLNQSDFGVLFPWITKRAFKAEEPERTLRLNVRAILQVLRDSDIHVAPTSQEDMEMTSSSPNSQTGGDSDILATDGRIRAWIPFGLSDGDTALSSSSSQQTIDLQGKADPFDAVMQEEVMETQNSKVKA